MGVVYKAIVAARMIHGARVYRTNQMIPKILRKEGLRPVPFAERLKEDFRTVISFRCFGGASRMHSRIPL
jgi:hypothetical protein